MVTTDQTPSTSVQEFLAQLATLPTNWRLSAVTYFGAGSADLPEYTHLPRLTFQTTIDAVEFRVVLRPVIARYDDTGEYFSVATPDTAPEDIPHEGFMVRVIVDDDLGADLPLGETATRTTCFADPKAADYHYDGPTEPFDAACQTAVTYMQRITDHLAPRQSDH